MRKLIPAPVRSFLRQKHRQYVFDRAMRGFMRSPDPKWIPDLIYGWNNQLWSALDEYIIACIGEAQKARGDIVECGSGLSTLILGAVAQHKGHKLWTLEHMDTWAARIRGSLQRYGIHSAVVTCAPLKDYGEFEWYDAPLTSMPARFAMAVCDGPPGSTKGGRYGMVPVLGSRLSSTVVLLDDASRPEEQEVARRWKAERGGTYEMLGKDKPYIRMQLGA